MGRGRGRSGGFTLVEALATIAVVAALGSVTSGLVLRASEGLSVSAVTAARAGEASLAMDRVARLLRGIPLKTGAGVRPNVTSLDPGDVQWSDASGAWRVRLNGGNLELTEPGVAAASVLLTGVTGFTVSAFDEANAALASSLSGTGCDVIRRLSVAITASTPGGRTVSLRTRVFLRSAVSGGSGQ